MSPLFQLLVSAYATIAVAGLYCLWQLYERRRQRMIVLHERVAYMLWVMAHTEDEGFTDYLDHEPLLMLNSKR